MAPRTCFVVALAPTGAGGTRGGSAAYHAAAMPASNASGTSLRTRMKLVVDITHPLFEDVRVDLCGGQVRVPQHHLNGAQVGTALQQVRGKRVSKHVGADRRFQARLPRVRLQDFPESYASKAVSSPACVD